MNEDPRWRYISGEMRLRTLHITDVAITVSHYDVNIHILWPSWDIIEKNQ